MARNRPSFLATRSVNQYRRRDILAYIGLRMYFSASASTSTRWARSIAPSILLSDNTSKYLKIQHFKGFSNGLIEHRALSIPTPNECIVESALIDACTMATGMKSKSCVYSYYFPSENSREGIFSNYASGLERRQSAIAKACTEAGSDAYVAYLDIQAFYPSITHDRALNEWKNCCGEDLDPRWRDVGTHLLNLHRSASANQNSILTGPMFSHLMANCYLRDIDNYCTQDLSCRYMRYVDDMTLVGTRNQIESDWRKISIKLRDIGLELHPVSHPKSMMVKGDNWIKCHEQHKVDDQSRHVSWPALIGDLKRLVVLNPKKTHEFQLLLKNHGLRLPLSHYISQTFEVGFAKRMLDLMNKKWFQRNLRGKNIEHVIALAKKLREFYLTRSNQAIEQIYTATGFERKQSISKARYYFGRMVYLASEEELLLLSKNAKEIPELYFHSQVMLAVATGEITNVIRMGTNACQAVAQALHAAGTTCRLDCSILKDPDHQLGLSIFVFNEVKVDGLAFSSNININAVLKVALNGGTSDLMQGEPSFARDLASLHGVSGSDFHKNLLNSPFDLDDPSVMDAIEQFQTSLSI